MSIASFDVFDTVLTREVGSPFGVFFLLGKQLNNMSLIQCSPKTFSHMRMVAEHRVRRNAIGGEINLSQIYVELGDLLKLTETQYQQLLKLEIEMEAKLLHVIPGAQNRIQNARVCGQHIVFLSDMYLSSDFIQNQLKRHGLWGEGDKCYVSCEYGKSKATGELFRELLHQVNLPPKLITHCGNDLNSDVQTARRIGLCVKPLLEGNPNRYEKILESYICETEGLSSVMAGASRLARLTIPALSTNQKALRDVAAGVVAPILVSFVLWILQRAQQMNLKRLYFISRDGQILLEIAHRLIKKLNISCELRYLYGSRQAWHLPSLTSIGKEQLAWILDCTDFLSIQSMLSRICIEPEDVRENLISFGFTERDWSRNLNLHERLAFRKILQEGRIQDIILQKAAQKRQIMIKYLKQEGLLDSTEYGIVDIGWHGRMQDSLAAVLSTIGRMPPIGFYFGLESGSLENKAGHREAYFFDKRLSLGLTRIIPGLISLLETFCAADHGAVVSFKEEAGRVQPILKGKYNQLVVNWGLSVVQETVCCFAEKITLNSSLINPWADVRSTTTKLLRTFWLNPSTPEAIAWSNFPYEDDQCGIYWNHLGERYRIKHIIKTFSIGRLPCHHRASWTAGSLVLTSSAIRFFLKFAICFTHIKKDLLSSVKHVIRNFLNILKDTVRLKCQ